MGNTKKIRSHSFLLTLLLFSSGLIACAPAHDTAYSRRDTGSSGTEEVLEEGTDTPEEVLDENGNPVIAKTTFKDVLDTVFVPGQCMTCHNAADLRGGMDIAVYGNVLTRANDMVDPLQSTLYQRLTVDDPDNDLPQMPRGNNPPLNAAQLAMILKWMTDGFIEE